MASPSTYRPARGFTLIELLIVIALVTLMIGLGLFVSIDTYHATLARSERDVIAGLLARARSSSMANIDDTAWGVCYIAPNYIVFRGTSCTAGTSTNEPTPAASDAVITGFASAIVFTQLSGTTTGGTITIVQQGKTSTITVNHEGAIQ